MQIVRWAPALLMVGIACSSDITNETPGGPREEVSLLRHRNLDLLFVVDDSGSMRQEQEALAVGFGPFVAALQDSDGRLPNLHIGVISSNLGTSPETGGGPACEGEGDDGVLLVPEACTVLTDGGRFIHDIEVSGERDSNVAGDLAEQFACMAQLGTAGCGFEQHLASMKRALENDDENAGFLRPEANLAVIIVADEDDCSAHDRHIFSDQEDDVTAPLGELTSFRCFEFGVECAEVEGGERALGPRTDCVAETDSPYIEPVSSYSDFLQGLKSAPDSVFVATISGDDSPVAVVTDPVQDERWLEPTCIICPGGTGTGCEATTTSGEGTPLVAAFPAIRLHALVDAMGGSGHAQSICSYDPVNDALDFGAALAGVAEQLAPRIDTVCLERAPLDIDQESPGMQASCEIVQFEPRDGDVPIETVIAACDAAPEVSPCFRLQDNADQCSGSGLELILDRGEVPAPEGSTISLRCALGDEA